MSLYYLSAAFAVLAMAPAQSASLAAPITQIAAKSDDIKLQALASSIEQDKLETEFLNQFREGKPISGFIDYSLQEVRDRAAKRKHWLSTISHIDPDSLSIDNRDTYRILNFILTDVPEDENEYWLNLDLTPYHAPMMIGSVQQILAAQPLVTTADSKNYVRLVGAYAAMLESLDNKINAQTARGVYLPKPALPTIRTTWVGLAGTTDALMPAEARLASLSVSDRDFLKAGVARLSETRITPAYKNILTSIGPSYEAKAPDTVGIGQFPGGKDVYRKLIHRYTTLQLTPDQLHEQGLAAVADVAGRMKAIREQLGFHGTSREFYDRISADPRFLAKSPADVEIAYQAYINAIEPIVPSYFRTLPTAPYGVKRLPLAVEAGQTFGYYDPPNAAEPHGLYYYNASDLEKRSLINAGTLIYHELIPGHHFQIAAQSENAGLSDFRKNYWADAFTEGWGEYAASLGIEMNLYDTPEKLYGRYVNEMFLAARLVVDTGMNYFGWPLEKARAYLRDVSSLSDLEINSETLRYSTGIPGQALAYRVGYDKLWDLRRAAQSSLGEKFDVRDFHDAVLASGARPLPLVEESISRMVTEKQKAAK